MSELDPAGLRAARRYAQWHIGDRAWADDILRAYNNPDDTNRRRDEEQK